MARKLRGLPPKASVCVECVNSCPIASDFHAQPPSTGVHPHEVDGRLVQLMLCVGTSRPHVSCCRRKMLT